MFFTWRIMLGCHQSRNNSCRNVSLSQYKATQHSGGPIIENKKKKSQTNYTRNWKKIACRADVTQCTSQRERTQHIYCSCANTCYEEWVEEQSRGVWWQRWHKSSDREEDQQSGRKTERKRERSAMTKEKRKLGEKNWQLNFIVRNLNSSHNHFKCQH